MHPFNHPALGLQEERQLVYAAFSKHFFKIEAPHKIVALEKEAAVEFEADIAHDHKLLVER